MANAINIKSDINCFDGLYIFTSRSSIYNKDIGRQISLEQDNK